MSSDSGFEDYVESLQYFDDDDEKKLNGHTLIKASMMSTWGSGQLTKSCLASREQSIQLCTGAY